MCRRFCAFFHIFQLGEVAVLEQYHTGTIRLMGTVIELKIAHPEGERLVAEVFEQLKRYEHRFSANDPTSELMAVNLAAGKHAVSVHPEIFHLVKMGLENSLAAGSRMNILIGPVVQTWRVGFSDARVPTDEEIKAKLQLTDATKVEMDEASQTIFLLEEGMRIDLGCIAKGYIADLVMQQLKELGVTSALINLGGNVLTLGPAIHHEDGNWWIGIQNPKLLRGENVALLPIQEESIVTSGVYERVLEVDGKKYHHILDPNTGYPAETDVASLTIVSKQSVDCEIWTTRLFGKKAHEILFEVEQHPNIEAVMILEDNRIFYTSGLASKIQLLERKYSNG